MRTPIRPYNGGSVAAIRLGGKGASLFEHFKADKARFVMTSLAPAGRIGGVDGRDASPP